ncbi:MAG TPA: HAD family hydrolase [Clostridiaceae bacterium]|nr:HAD family hydrolase [Clostridiaceae bacterium]
MKYKAVIFDLDGTLLNTIDDIANSVNSVLEKSGFPVHSTEEIKLFIGTGFYNLIRLALPEENRDDSTIKKLVEMLREEYNTRWNQYTRPYEGIPELLDELTKRNIKKAVLSNKADNFTKIIIAQLLPKWQFEVVWGERPDVPKKPDPTAALEIADMLNISPDEIILLGDSSYDIQTAVSAGMFAAGALWGFRSADELKSAGADILIEKPLDLLKLF